MRARHVSLALSPLLCTLAGAFSFTDTPGTQCDNINIQWTGGTTPFQLMIIPIFGTPRNITIPADSFSNGAGSFSTQLPLAQGRQYLLTMSDASGLGSGGYTPLRTVGPSKGGSCSTNDPGVAFSFELNTALQQCRPFTFSAYSNAIQPVTAIAIVPGGKAVVLRPPIQPSFDWTVTAPSGTSMVFMMIDAAGRPGGASDVRTVGITDDATCVDGSSPTSTASSSSSISPSATPSASKTSRLTSSASSRASTSPATTGTGVPTSSGFSTAAIAGTVAGALVFLAVAITLGLFFLRKTRLGSGSGQSHRLQSQINLIDSNPKYHPYRDNYTPGSSHFLPSGGQYDPTPYMLSQPQESQPHQLYTYGSHDIPARYSQTSQPSYQNRPPYMDYDLHPAAPRNPNSIPTVDIGAAVAPMAAGHQQGAPSLSNTEVTSSAGQPSRQSMASTTPTAAQRKAAMAGDSAYKPPSRFILHTDAEDDLPPPNEDGVVELPPQYSERRAPLPNVPQPDLPRPTPPQS